MTPESMLLEIPTVHGTAYINPRKIVSISDLPHSCDYSTPARSRIDFSTHYVLSLLTARQMMQAIEAATDRGPAGEKTA